MPDPADPSAPGADRKGDKKSQSGNESLLELVSIIAVAVGLALLIQAFVVKPYRIPSRSMVPALQVGQRVLVNRLDGRFGTPDRGDIVVFRPPAGAGDNICGVQDGEEYLPGEVYVSGNDGTLAERMPCPKGTPGKYEETYIKRVVGLPGERLKIIRGHAYINGKRLDEPYINPDESCDVPNAVSSDCTFSLDITIPPDSFFMMGDNRDASDDSRYWGPVSKQNIIGEAFVTYWPLKRVGLF